MLYIDRRRWSGTVLGLSAYWENGLSVDISWMPTEQIPIRSQRWAILLSKTPAFAAAIEAKAAMHREQPPAALDNSICHKLFMRCGGARSPLFGENLSMQTWFWRRHGSSF